jgi:hypothetical protein
MWRGKVTQHFFLNATYLVHFVYFCPFKFIFGRFCPGVKFPFTLERHTVNEFCYGHYDAWEG